MSYPITILGAPCIPYVIGYSLNYNQLCVAARVLCTTDQLNVAPDHPEFAMNLHLTEKGSEQLILRYKEGNGRYYYLWVKGVMPSFTGKKPAFRVPPVDYSRYPSLEGLGEVKPRCIQWPLRMAVPQWFPSRLESYTTLMLQKYDDERPIVDPVSGEQDKVYGVMRDHSMLSK
ncbi:hypothetical protein MSAN_00371700 [Mycena sanguinolenta]|uniref:Uncharacterized protein n=1 Tax=Mycena sanguinolenta TaxID=230812 RepID=A0A8H6ZCG3_9AGAR|nr:hypothetical protein MSAN_00371700 [Mycena sanguinolenta]